VALVATLFFIVRQLFDYRIAASALLLVASFPPLYGNGKSVLGEVPGLFFLALFLYFILLIEKTNYATRRYYIFAGLAAGLCVAAKPLFILLLPSVAAGMFLLRKSIHFHWKHIALGIATFFIPVAVWINMQASTDDSFFKTLMFYSNPYVVPMQDMSALVLSNIKHFFTDTSASYFLFIFITWLSSFVVRIFLKKRITFTESIAMFYSLLVVLAYVRTAGWHRYFFTAEIFALLFFPSALYFFFQLFSEKIKQFKKLNYLFVVMAISLLIAAGHTSKLWSDSWVARSYADTKTAELEKYVGGIDPQKTVLVYDVPESVIFLPTKNYYQTVKLGSGTLGEHEQDIRRGFFDLVIVRRGFFEDNKSDFALYSLRDDLSTAVILEKSDSKLYAR